MIKTVTRMPSTKQTGKLKVFVVLLCVMVLSFALHYKKDVLMNYILPGDANVTAAALNTLVGDLGEGESIGDAVTAFCREIIDHANIPG